MSVHKTADQMKDEGNAALRLEKYDDAIRHYSLAIELNPKNHVFYSNRSAAYCKAGKYKEALEDAKRTIALKSDWAKGYSRKGASLAYLKQYDAALEAYRQGLVHDPSNSQIKEGIKEVEKQINDSNNYSSNPFSEDVIRNKLASDERTRELLTDPEYIKFIKELQGNPSKFQDKLSDPRLMKTFNVLFGSDFNISPDTDSSNVEENMDSVESESSMDTEITQKLEKALSEKERGNLEYKMKNLEAALVHYDKAIELDPTDITFYTNKAAVYFEKKEFEKCIESCEKAIEVGSENRADYKKLAKANSRMALAYVKIGNLPLAKKYYQKSLTEHRTQETVKKLNEIENTIKEEEKKAYIDPQKSLEEKNKGKDAFMKGDYPTAIRHYTEAIKRNPEDAVLYSNRAACYQKLAEFPLALKDCETCISLDPKFVRGYVRKGMALSALKENSKASVAFQKALEVEPNNKEALEGYAKCRSVRFDNPEEARKTAMSDPEVQKILSDPAMRLILDQMQRDPRAAEEHLKDPIIGAKIQKLFESGIIAIR